MTLISVCCLTFNCERTIRKTLESVRPFADEIAVVDSFSTDTTLDIVREFTDRIFQLPYLSHGIQMNKAIERSSHDWVFCIDSDEVVDETMIRHLRRLKAEGLEGKEAFRLRRSWLFLGRQVHAFYPAVSPDRIVRLFDRRVSRFNERAVHDKPIGHKRCDWLEGMLIHDSTGSLRELFDKMNRYTTEHVLLNATTAKEVHASDMLLNPVGAFIKWYFLKKNCLDGFPGLVLGAYAGMYTFMKYAKLYDLKKKNLPAIKG